MSFKVDPEFQNEIKKYGDVNIEECFNCGNCTAICSLSTEQNSFPRKNIRLLQLGLKDRILQNIDPWLCYYCGECSETCPKGAEPAEAMMAVRRWLITQYDRSGHGEKIYTSSKAAWLAILRYSMIPVVLLIIGHVLSALGVKGFGNLAIITDHVELNTFAPA
ncbi:MAG: 4Fe-4S dicluster domain-containing protein, partial [Anaerolineales bacterium]|nr:4Fe-4S dicluster domain-containing protein [Anaerolineales bacterium]